MLLQSAKRLFGISLSIISLNSSTRKYIKCTFDALLLDLFSTFCSANCLTHAQTFGDMALCSMEAASEQEKRRRGNLNWSLVNLETFFFFFPLSLPECLHGRIKSTPLAQTLVATRGSLWCCCHGFPAGLMNHQLMPRLEAVTKSL